MFNFLKKKSKVVLSKVQIINNTLAKKHHETRIANLTIEFNTLSDKVKKKELDINIPKNLKHKETDLMIRRMSILKNEIDIRKDLSKWL